MMHFGLPTHANDEASKANRTGYYYSSCETSYPSLYTLQSALFVHNFNLTFDSTFCGWDGVMAFLLVF